jgi:hypothetical protein
MGESHHKNGRRKGPKRRFVMGNFTTQDQQENQEQDGRMLSRVMHYRSQEQEVGGDELGIEKNGGVF